MLPDSITLLQLSCLLGGAWAAPVVDKLPLPQPSLGVKLSASLNIFPPHVAPTLGPKPTTLSSKPPTLTLPRSTSVRSTLSVIKPNPTLPVPILPPVPTKLPSIKIPVPSLSATFKICLPSFQPTLIPPPRPIIPILPLKNAGVEERAEATAQNAQLQSKLAEFKSIVDDVKERVAQVETTVKAINGTAVTPAQVSSILPGLTDQLGGILGSVTGLPGIIGTLTSLPGLTSIAGPVLEGLAPLTGGISIGGTNSSTSATVSVSPVTTYLSLWGQLFNDLGQLVYFIFNTGPLLAIGANKLLPFTGALSSILGTVGGAIPL